MNNLIGAVGKSQLLKGKHLPLFNSAVNKNYQLLNEFPVKAVATEISSSVKKLIGITADTKWFVRAYGLK